MQTVNTALSLAADLAELAWLYLQLYALRAEIHGAALLHWLAANPDGAMGTACGLAGAFVLSISRKREALGWLLFLASNAALIVLGQRLQRPDIVILQCGFTITSLLGVWRTAVRPCLQWDEWRGDFEDNPVMLIKHLARWRGYRLDLHKMVAPDAEGCFHTHPAKAVRIVFWNGYVEEIEAPGQQERQYENLPAGAVGIVQSELCHRIHALPRGASYSLWLRWPKSHEIQLRGPGWPAGSKAA